MKKKFKLPDGWFMKVVVVFCIAYAVYITERTLGICEKIGVTPQSVYVAAVGFFGAELIMTLVKKVTDGKSEEKDEKGKGGGSKPTI